MNSQRETDRRSGRHPSPQVFPQLFASSSSVCRKATGNYDCNTCYVYKDVYLYVLALAPDIEDVLDDVVTVKLTCKAFGSPKPRVKWIRDGLKLTGGRYHIMDSGDLEITKLGLSFL